MIFLKVKRVSLSEAAQLEPHVCLSGVGGALVAPNEVAVPPYLNTGENDIHTKPNKAMVDPWLLAMTHVWAAEEAGAELRTSCEV